LKVYLDETQVDPARVLWAGFSPGNAGLYQVNMYLPEDAGPDPEIRLLMGNKPSAPGIKLAVRISDAPDPQLKPAGGR
jgi:uncharacterized protein (TIGR03437 family)